MPTCSPLTLITPAPHGPLQGLGKTLESLSLFAYLKHFKNNEGPHLVIVSVSSSGTQHL